MQVATQVLREKAEEAGHLTHEDIARHAGIERSAVTRLLAGRTPSLATVVRLTRAYGIPLEDLIPSTEAGQDQETPAEAAA